MLRSRTLGLSAVALALALLSASSACDDFGEDKPTRVQLTPHSAKIAYAQADGRSWDGETEPAPGLAQFFYGDTLPEGLTVADTNRFESFDTAPDPFVEIYMDARLLLTTAADQNNLLPYWDSAPLELEVYDGSRFWVRVWDQDEGVQDPIGEAEFRGADLTTGNWELALSMGQVRDLRLLIHLPDAPLEGE